MAFVRGFCALLLCSALAGVSGWSQTRGLGTILVAQKAYLGHASASTGTTVFDGDKLSTELSGVIQVSLKAARLQLVQSGAAELGETQGIPTATLLRGTAVFSTAGSNAFLLHASIADIRTAGDGPAVGQVSMVSPKELRVLTRRGTLAVTVDGETKMVPEATAYRVLLDPEAVPPEPAQQAEGAGAKKGKRKAIYAGRSRVIYIVGTAVAVSTYFAVQEALESPDRP